MAAAALLPIEDAISSAELVARFTALELLEAQRETSPTYNGLVLKHALLIVQCRIRCKSVTAMARHLGMSNNATYRWARGVPIQNRCFERGMRELAFLQASWGVD